MSVLSREVDAYQRAVDAYQRQVNKHNRAVDKYRATIARDASGQMLLADAQGNIFGAAEDGKLSPSSLQSGQLTDYGLTQLPDDDRFRLVRQGPTDQKRETKSGIFKYSDPESATEYFYEDAPSYGDDGVNRKRLGPEWRMDKATPGQEINSGEFSPTIYDVSRDASVYSELPEKDIPGFTARAPSATTSQVRRAGMPSMAEIEGGLVGEVMRGGGVRYGVPVYRPKG
jgi:hypothetical protein